jgi:Na+:H+ antiporter, NhaC family
MHNEPKRGVNLPQLWQGAIPLLVLFVGLFLAVMNFGDEATGGPVQIVLMCAGLVAGVVGLSNGLTWSTLEKAVSEFSSMVIIPIMLLFSIGGLIGVWLASGVIPTLIVFGSEILHPSIFYAAVLVLCSVVAMSSGSAWTTAGTIGVALMGISQASDLSLPITAGAIISGVYFGDKLSPLSDTTNLASGMAGAELFVHVRYMLWTTVPAFLIALVVFLFLSLRAGQHVDTAQLALLTETLSSNFTISWALLLPMAILVGLAVARVPPLMAIVISIIVGVVFGLAFQRGEQASLPQLIVDYWRTAATGYEAHTGVADADELLSRGGMASMMTTVWLILSAMFFSGMMERTGCLQRILNSVVGLMRKDRSIFFGVGATALFGNIVAADQYLSIVLSTRMYADEVHGRGFRPEMLSRTAEDFGTVTSPLVPWNTCGAFMAATLGVGTLTYLPFCIFNIASPLVACIYIGSGIALRRREASPASDLISGKQEAV